MTPVPGRDDTTAAGDRDAAEMRLVKVLAAKGKRGFLYAKSAEVPLRTYRKRPAPEATP